MSDDTMSAVTKFGVACEGEAVVAVSQESKMDSGLRRNDAEREAKRQIAEYLEGTRRTFELKLTPKGTQFQQRVWAELLKIPYGQTRSYQDIANAIGKPKATRAVGGALNKNPIPLIIPCHRVVGKNGSMTGFALGIPVKEWLLELERR